MRRPTPLLLVLLLPACGAEVIAAAPSPAAPVVAVPVLSTTPITPAPTPSTPGLSACTTARPDGSLLTLVAGADLLALDTTGTWRTLDAAEPTTPPAVVTGVDVSADGYVAISRQHRLVSSGVENTYALLGPDGAVRWRRAQTVRYGGSPVRVELGLQQLFVSTGGAVVANHTSFDTMIHASVEGLSVDGESRWLEGAAAVGAADDDGRVLVESYPNSGSALRWWSSRGGAVEALDGGGAPGGTSMVGPFAVTLETSASGVSVVSRRGAHVDRYPLPFADAMDVSFHAAREEGWLLLSGRGEDGVEHRVDLNTGRVDTIALRYPAGLRAVGTYPRAGVDADGALLAVLRDDEQAGLFRSTDGTHWDLVGRHVTGTLGFATYSRAGTYVVQAHNDLYGGESWPEDGRADPEALCGPSLHIVRPTTGREVVVYASDPERRFGHGPEVALTSTGRCAAWVESTADGSSTVEIADLVDGSRRRAPLPHGATGGRLRWF